MPVLVSYSACPVVNAFLRPAGSPAGSADADWLNEIDLDQLDASSLELLPLLSDRLSARSLETSPAAASLGRLMGVCKRGWARNQVQLQELASVWSTLAHASVPPLAICGPAAWALVYQLERSVRPIASLHVMIARRYAVAAKDVLEANGWRLQPDMPNPEGLTLDSYPGLWFRSASGSALFLLWRLRSVSPEVATENEPTPATIPVEIFGTAAARLAPEELLLSCLQRADHTDDDRVHWQTDAVVLLRNEAPDWDRFRRLMPTDGLVAESLRGLQTEHQLSIPENVLRPAAAAQKANVVERLWTDYRQVSWADGQPHNLRGFALYALRRSFIAWSGSRPQDEMTTLSSSGGTRLGEYARYRTLFFFLMLRDIRLRYRRTWRGIVWAVVQPLLPMLIFAAIFSKVLRPELQHGPYWLFVLIGLAPWNFFANSVNYASTTFVGNYDLLNKVYFPRAILPAASVSALLLDLLVSSSFVAALSWWEGYPPTAKWLALPIAIVAAAVVGMTTGLAAASLNILHRDLKPLVSFLVQVWLYATPVLYPLELLPSHWQWIAWLNPMTAVVAGFRFAFLGTPYDWLGGLTSVLTFAALTLAAVTLFHRLESDMAEML